MKNGSLRWTTIALLALLCVCLCMIPNSVFATNSLDDAEQYAAQPAEAAEAVPDVIEAEPEADATAAEPEPSQPAAEAEEPAAEPESEEPAAEPEAQPAAEEFPAQTIDDTAANGVKVTVSAEEGVLPADSSVTVRELTEAEAAPYRAALEKQGVPLENVRFLDVTILDANDKEVEPNDGGEVEVSFSGLGFASDADLTIYHFADEQNQQKQGMFSFFKGNGKKLGSPERITPDKKRGGKITFHTRHFSV